MFKWWSLENVPWRSWVYFRDLAQFHNTWYSRVLTLCITTSAAVVSVSLDCFFVSMPRITDNFLCRLMLTKHCVVWLDTVWLICLDSRDSVNVSVSEKKSPCLLQRRYFSLTFLVDVYTLHRAERRLIICRVCVCVWLVCTSAKHPNWCFSFVDREISAHWKPQTTAGSNAKILIYFQIKYTEAILSNSSRKLFWFEITKLLIAV